MKKILLSTALVVATAGVAAAEVKLSGYGRFGLDYNGGAVAPVSKTQVNMRMRLNIDASVETESGVTFGGRIRMQYNSGNVAATLSPAKLYASYNGMRMEVGNVDTAYDSAALMYSSEMGYLDRSFGDPQASYYGFSSGAYGAAEANRMGIFMSYSIGEFNVRLSAVDPNQALSADALLATDDETELSLSADYSTGQFTVSAAVAKDAAGISNNDLFFIGGEYKFSDAGAVGLTYNDNGDSLPAAVGDDGRTITLYGNYTFGATTVRAYVANTDSTANSAPGFTKTAYGIGADYDLGGARLSGAVHRNYAKKTIADVGVRFDF